MLTQAEIDALLAGSLEAEQPHSEQGVNLADLIGTGPAAPASAPKEKPAAASGKQIRPYNFWSPERFSKDQMRAIELIHENLAERLTTSLPPYLRTEFRPRMVHMEQGRSDDFIKDLPPGTLFHVMALEPLPGRLVLVISSELMGVILERLLGGAGPGDQKPRPLTDIGQSLIKGTVEYMLGDFKAAWSKVVALEPQLEDSTVNHHWVQMMLGNARVVLITFEITIQGTTGTMSIYIPFSTLKPVANVLNPHVWISGRDNRPDEAVRERTVRGVHNLPVILRVVLGGADLTVSELLGLQPGDVIRLDTKTREDLVVCVGEREQFLGRAGIMDGRLAVQIGAPYSAVNG
ncbi:MAG: flagellar motor switch protein FliM [Anaerolineales bacterium]|nr:flagellar motor switch protein FliM [Anaerolineales bacterium]